jgi:protein-S-isoprenylcysteine O-methyltransferase Ste14
MMAVIYSSIPLFWFTIHPFVARWRRMHKSPYRGLLPLWFLMIGAVGWLSWPWNARQIYSNPWLWLPALPFLIAGLRVYSRILSEFGAHKLSGEAELRPQEHEQQLVTTGLHARARHPIYFAHLCNLLGWTIGSGLAVNFVLLALSMMIAFPIMIKMEERELEQRFGESYRVYQSRVPVIPFLPFKSTHLDGVGRAEERA